MQRLTLSLLLLLLLVVVVVELFDDSTSARVARSKAVTHSSFRFRRINPTSSRQNGFTEDEEEEEEDGAVV